jgi:hypothetical protein
MVDQCLSNALKEPITLPVESNEICIQHRQVVELSVQPNNKYYFGHYTFDHFLPSPGAIFYIVVESFISLRYVPVGVF